MTVSFEKRSWRSLGHKEVFAAWKMGISGARKRAIPRLLCEGCSYLLVLFRAVCYCVPPPSKMILASQVLCPHFLSSKRTSAGSQSKTHNRHFPIQNSQPALPKSFFPNNLSSGCGDWSELWQAAGASLNS